MKEVLDKEFGLEGRTAVVTGAGSGICREIALVLAEAGAEVMLADLNKSGMIETAGLIGQSGSKSRSRRTDVTTGPMSRRLRTRPWRRWARSISG